MSLVHATECGNCSCKPGPSMDSLEERKRKKGAQPKLTVKGAEGNCARTQTVAVTHKAREAEVEKQHYLKEY